MLQEMVLLIQSDDQTDGKELTLRYELAILSASINFRSLIANCGCFLAAWKGYAIAGVMLCLSLTQTLVETHYNFKMNQIGIRARGSLMTKVHNKAVRLSEPAFQRIGVGKIVNLVQIDCMKFSWAMYVLHMMWSLPLMLVIAVVLLYQQVCLSLSFRCISLPFTVLSLPFTAVLLQLGVAAFVGLGVMLIFSPLNMKMMQNQFKFQKRTVERRDKRVELLTELLQGMKLIKLLGWENQMSKQLDHKREHELASVKANALSQAVSTCIWICAPILVNVGEAAIMHHLGFHLWPLHSLWLCLSL